MNYSAMAQAIVHYEVTIGYDVPHAMVEKLLIQAAHSAPGLLAVPEPFVLIRNLDNNFVAYEINAYTDKPNELITTYSKLMRKILDTFREAGVEILSPQYVAIRDSGSKVKRGRPTPNRRPRTEARTSMIHQNSPDSPILTLQKPMA